MRARSARISRATRLGWTIHIRLTAGESSAARSDGVRRSSPSNQVGQGASNAWSSQVSQTAAISTVPMSRFEQDKFVDYDTMADKLKVRSPNPQAVVWSRPR